MVSRPGRAFASRFPGRNQGSLRPSHFRFWRASASLLFGDGRLLGHGGNDHSPAPLSRHGEADGEVRASGSRPYQLEILVAVRFRSLERRQQPCGSSEALPACTTHPPSAYNGGNPSRRLEERMAESWKQWEGTIVDGKFRLEQFLGGSDHSAVFLTQPSEGGAKAAIKFVPACPQALDFQRTSWEQT